MSLGAVLLVCLQTLGDTVVLSPSSPANMDGVIDAPVKPVGPIFLPDPETIGSGATHLDTLAQTTDETLQTSSGVSLAVRANTVVVAVSHGLTDRLDATLLLPIVEEHVTATVTRGAITGQTQVTFSGPSDLSLWLKYALLPGLAATLKATFPTGNPANGLGTGAYFLTPGLAARTSLGPAELSARVSYRVDLSSASKSSLNYGAGLAAPLYRPWLGVAVEFLGQSGTGTQDPLILFGVDYAQRHSEILAFGVRAVVHPRLMAFVAGSYALTRGGLRDDRVFPTVGLVGTF